MAVAPLSWQWVHRQGVEALDSLVVSLADPEAAGWWRQQLVAGPVALGAQESQGPVVAVMALDPAAPAAPVILESAELEPEDESLLPTAADSSSDFWLSEGPEVEEVPLADFVALGGTPVAGDLAHGEALGAGDGSFEAATPAVGHDAMADRDFGDGLAATNLAKPLPITEAAAFTDGVPLKEPAASESSGATPFAEATGLHPPMAAVAPQPPAPAAQFSGADEQATAASESGPAAVAAAEAAPVRVGRFARLRHLVRDCFEEVASTFQGQDEEAEAQLDDAFASTPERWLQDSPTTASPGENPLPADRLPVDPLPGQTLKPFSAPWAAIETKAAETPRPLSPSPAEHLPSALQQPAPQQPVLQLPAQQQPLQQPSAVARLPLAPRPAQALIRPAPAPAHPALDQLRAWLPDESLDPPQRRAS